MKHDNKMAYRYSMFPPDGPLKYQDYIALYYCPLLPGYGGDMVSYCVLPADKIQTGSSIDDCCPSPRHFSKDRLYVIGHVFGVVCATWGRSEQDALDEAADRGWLDAFQLDDPPDQTAEDDENIIRLGNASEPFNGSDMWIGTVQWALPRDIRHIMAQCCAIGGAYETLDGCVPLRDIYAEDFTLLGTITKKVKNMKEDAK